MKNFLIIIIFTIIFSCFSFSHDCSDGHHIKFEENKGQFLNNESRKISTILFKGSNIHTVYYITSSGFSVAFQENDSTKRRDIKFLNHNSNFTIEAHSEVNDYKNYYLSHCSDGILNVKSFKEVVLINYYDGIDLKYYSTKEGDLEYDFIIHPNSDPRQIQIQTDGINYLENENLISKSEIFNIKTSKPISFQKDIAINSSFLIQKPDAYGFKIENYNEDEELVIDPVVRRWGTYYSGTCPVQNNNPMNSVTNDSQGNTIVAGNADCDLGIASPGAYQTIKNGPIDVMLVKFDKSGNRLWSTFYGGNQADFSDDLAIISDNDIILTGKTRSTDLMGVGGAFPNLGGGGDYYIARFNANGERVWGTYYGGNSNEKTEPKPSSGVAVDNQNFIYFAGETNSTNFFGGGGFQPNNNGGTEAFLAKFDPDGNLLWRTFYGGEGNETGVKSVVTDNAGNVYFTGTTNSNSSIASNGWLNNNPSPNINSGFLAKFDPNGNREWASYFGGINPDAMSAITIDDREDVYLLGISESPNLNIGPNLSEFQAGQSNIILAKFLKTGDLVWSAYGPCPGSAAIDIKHNKKGFLIATGATMCSGINTEGGFQNQNNGSSELFITKFSENGLPVWATYYGGEGFDNPQALSYYSEDDNITIVGSTRSNNIIGDGGFYDENPTPSNNNDTHGFVVQLRDIEYSISSISPQNPCLGEDLLINFEYENNQTTSFETRITAILSDDNGSFDNPIQLGIKFTSGSGNMTIQIPTNIQASPNYRLRLVGSSNVINLEITDNAEPDFSGELEVCAGIEYNYSAELINNYEYEWFATGGEIIGASNSENITIIWDSGISKSLTLVANNTINDCSGTITREVNEIEKALITAPDFICLNSEITLSAEIEGGLNGATIIWNVPENANLISQNASEIRLIFSESGNYSVTMSQITSDASCTFFDTKDIFVPDFSEITGDNLVCENQLVEYNLANIINGNSYEWSVVGGLIIGSTDSESIQVEWGNGSSGTITLEETNDETDCENESEFSVLINSNDFEIIGDFELCPNVGIKNYTTDATGGELLWEVTNGNIIGDASSQNIDVNWGGNQDGILQLTISINNGNCESSASKTITFDQSLAPSPEIIGNSKVCPDQIYSYSVEENNNNTFEWLISGGQIVGDANSFTVTVIWDEAVEDGQLIAAVSNSLDCQESTSFNVQIGFDSPQIIGDSEICSGIEYTYSAVYDNSQSINWDIVGGEILGNANNQEVKVIWNNNAERLILSSVSEGDICLNSIDFPVNISDNNSTVLEIADLTVDPSIDTGLFNIPVTIKELSCNSNFTESNILEAYLSVRSSMFLPTSNQIQSYENEEEDRKIKIESIFNQININDLFFNLEGYILIGDRLETEILIDSIKINSNHIEFEKEGGIISLSNIPNNDGRRLIYRTFVFNNLYPNPSDGNFTLEIESDENTDIEISVFSILGEKILHKSDLIIKGNNKLNISLPSNLNSGLYRVVLRSNGLEINDKVLIK